MLDVMALEPVGTTAARELAAAIAQVESPPNRGRNGAGLAPHIEHFAASVLASLYESRHQTAIAGHSAQGFGAHALSVIEHSREGQWLQGPWLQGP